MEKPDTHPAGPTLYRWVSYAEQNHVVPTDMESPSHGVAACGVTGMSAESPSWDRSVPACAWCLHMVNSGELVVEDMSETGQGSEGGL